MTHDRYGRTTQRRNGGLTHRVSSTDSSQPDGVLNKTARMKISTSGRVSEDFTRLLFLPTHRETSILVGELPIDLSTWSFIPLPRFFNSRRVSPLLNQSLVLIPQQSA